MLPTAHRTSTHLEVGWKERVKINNAPNPGCLLAICYTYIHTYISVMHRNVNLLRNCAREDVMKGKTVHRVCACVRACVWQDMRMCISSSTQYRRGSRFLYYICIRVGDGGGVTHVYTRSSSHVGWMDGDGGGERVHARPNAWAFARALDGRRGYGETSPSTSARAIYCARHMYAHSAYT